MGGDPVCACGLPDLAGRPALVNMVHDELLVEVDSAHAEAARSAALVQAMLGAGVDPRS